MERNYSSLYTNKKSFDSSLEAAVFKLSEVIDLDDEPIEDKLMTTIEELRNAMEKPRVKTKSLQKF